MSLLIISDDISIRMVKRKALGMNFTHITDHSAILHTILVSTLIMWLQKCDHFNFWRRPLPLADIQYCFFQSNLICWCTIFFRKSNCETLFYECRSL